jgi:EAL domain-containing protein (putative c-di-GMP-specific phosphodiesterase class I)
LAIDDFGTGYSSLAYLKSFPIDTLKIDRSFIDKLGHDAGDTAIVHTIATLAKTLNLTITAEGVETPEQLHYLWTIGCDRGQGFYFAKPLSIDTVSNFLNMAQGTALMHPDRAITALAEVSEILSPVLAPVAEVLITEP